MPGCGWVIVVASVFDVVLRGTLKSALPELGTAPREISRSVSSGRGQRGVHANIGAAGNDQRVQQIFARAQRAR